MKNDKTKIFFDLLNDDEYCLLYNGTFIDAVTAKIIHVSKVSLIQRGELIKTQNRLAYLIAESFQNIIRHGGHKEHNIKELPLPGFFMIKIRNNFYDLVTGNLIQNENIASLKKHFHTVNSLNNDELKLLYKKTLAEGQLSEKGGAGIGLIDMAKKSAQKLEYRFFESSNKKSMFYQRLVLASNVDILDRVGSDHNIEYGIKLHETMMDQNILVLQKSDFSRDSVMPMLSIVEENIISNKIYNTPVKIIYQILTEIIQFVNHNQIIRCNNKEGIFLISKNNNKYNIGSGYCVDNDKIKLLKDYIKFSNIKHVILKVAIPQMAIIDQEGVIYSETKEEDIGKNIAEQFCFEFEKIDSKTSFFSINTTL